jgi:hypothetical protein
MSVPTVRRIRSKIVLPWEKQEFIHSRPAIIMKADTPLSLGAQRPIP